MQTSRRLGVLPPPCGEGLGVGVLQRITALPPPRRFAPTLPTRGRVRSSSRRALGFYLSPIALKLVRRAAIAFDVGVFEEAARLLETLLVGEDVAFVGVLIVGKFQRQ